MLYNLTVLGLDLEVVCFNGAYVGLRKPGAGPHANKVYFVWSRWVHIEELKSEEEVQNSDSAHIPLLHPIENLPNFRDLVVLDFIDTLMN